MHNPRYQYDCKRCKYSWCCGYVCTCVLRGADAPPREVQINVNRALKDVGLKPQFGS